MVEANHLSGQLRRMNDLADLDPLRFDERVQERLQRGRIKRLGGGQTVFESGEQFRGLRLAKRFGKRFSS